VVSCVVSQCSAADTDAGSDGGIEDGGSDAGIEDGGLDAGIVDGGSDAGGPGYAADITIDDITLVPF